MDITKLLPFLLCTFGIFSVLSSIAKLPTKRRIATMKNFGEGIKTFSDTMENFALSLASRIEKVIKPSIERKKRIEKELDIANIDKSAENFIAYAISKGIVKGLLVLIVVIFVNKVLLIGAVYIAFKEFTMEMNRPKSIIKKKKDAIESEIYRFVATIEGESRNHNNVMKMLENYKKTAGTEMKREIEALIVDMSLTDYEMALSRFDNRINSSMLSEVIKCLISTLQGNNNTQNFQMLALTFKKFEEHRLEKIGKKIPAKVTKFSMLMLLSLVVLIFTMLGIQLVNDAGGIL